MTNNSNNEISAKIALYTNLQRNRRWCGLHALVICPGIARIYLSERNALFTPARANEKEGGYVERTDAFLTSPIFISPPSNELFRLDLADVV